MDALRRGLILILVFSGMDVFSAPWPEVTNGLTELEEKAGWQLLFDGVDEQAHWRVGFNNTSNWSVEDSAMLTPNEYHWLMTRDEFENFEFSAVWKINQGGNSGIIWRVTQEHGDYCSGPEYGILDEVSGGDRNEMSKNPGEENMPIKITASCYDIYVTKENGDVNGEFVSPASPIGEWNHGVIFADGLHVEHWLNEQKVVDYLIGSDDWQARYERSKFYPGCGDQYGKLPGGFIGLQAHGASLYAWYRNLKIRPFTPGEELVSPTITLDTSNAEDSVIAAMAVAITGAQIRYTLDDSDPDGNSEEYTGPVVIKESSTLKAITIRPDFQNSQPEVAEITINSTSTRQAGRQRSRLQTSLVDGTLTFTALDGSLDVRLTISDLAGNRRYETVVKTGRTTSVSGLNPGFYLIQFTGANQTTFQKILIP